MQAHIDAAKKPPPPPPGAGAVAQPSLSSSLAAPDPNHPANQFHFTAPGLSVPAAPEFDPVSGSMLKMQGRFHHLRQPLGLDHEQRQELERFRNQQFAHDDFMKLRQNQIQKSRDFREDLRQRRETFAMLSEDHAAQALRQAQGLHVPTSTQINEAAPAVAASGPRNKVKKTITRQNEATETTGARNRKRSVSKKDSDKANPGRPVITQQASSSSTRNKGRNKDPRMDVDEAALAADIADDKTKEKKPALALKDKPRNSKFLDTRFPTAFLVNP